MWGAGHGPGVPIGAALLYEFSGHGKSIVRLCGYRSLNGWKCARAPPRSPTKGRSFVLRTRPGGILVGAQARDAQEVELVKGHEDWIGDQRTQGFGAASYGGTNHRRFRRVLPVRTKLTAQRGIRRALVFCRGQRPLLRGLSLFVTPRAFTSRCRSMQLQLQYAKAAKSTSRGVRMTLEHSCARAVRYVRVGTSALSDVREFQIPTGTSCTLMHVGRCEGWRGTSGACDPEPAQLTIQPPALPEASSRPSPPHHTFSFSPSAHHPSPLQNTKLNRNGGCVISRLLNILLSTAQTAKICPTRKPCARSCVRSCGADMRPDPLVPMIHSTRFESPHRRGCCREYDGEWRSAMYASLVGCLSSSRRLSVYLLPSILPACY